MTRVLITDHVFPGLETEHAMLEPLGAEVIVAPDTDEQTLLALADRVDGMLVCFANISEQVVEVAARGGCRIIARYGIGYDNIPVQAASSHGILVTNVPDYCLDEVADHTIALLLAAARGLVPALREVAAGGWSIPHPGIHRLAGRQLTIVGLGGIGRRVATRARALGLAVVGVDPFVAPGELDGVELAGDLRDAVRDADFISLHLPMTAETHHLIGREAIGWMRRAPVLINTARGGLVDLDAVVEALGAGALSGVALDVTESEPLPAEHPLRTDPRAVITPHMAFASIEATAELQRRATAEVVRALRGEAPDRPVNPEVLGK